MPILIAAGLTVLVLWLLFGLGRSGPKAKTSTAIEPAAEVARATPRHPPIASASVTPESCWVPHERGSTIVGYTIPDGMLYVGKGLVSISGHRVEPALIDPSLATDRANPDRHGREMGYWPSYSAISPRCRAAYLEWLAGGRRDPSAYIGYVFLYFYGLERRALADAPRSELARREVPAIIAEVQQLLGVYGANTSFRGYARRLLDVLMLVADEDDDVQPPMEGTGDELPASVRIGIGRLVAAGKPVPGDWALSWFLTHPTSSLRTAAQRCPAEFRELFRIRYAREYGQGLMVNAPRSRLKIAITPASPSFGKLLTRDLDLPDIGALTLPVSKLQRLGESCGSDLDAFSRWVGRHANVPKTIAAVALLPAELAASHGSSEVQALYAWIESTIGPHDRVLGRTDDLLKHCTSFGTGKLAKSEAVLLAQLLERRGYGIEPDVRFGGPPLGPGGTAVLFNLPRDSASIASPQFAAATSLLHLAVAVSAADGTISPAEERLLQDHMQRALALSEAERVRLSAHLTWLMEARPSLSGLKKRLEPLDSRQRSAIAEFVIGLAGADGQISPEEVQVLGKIYPMLGMPAEDVYGHVHAMAAGGPVAVDDEPVTVVQARSSVGYAVPPRPDSAEGVRLNMAAVHAKLAESAQISALLGDIFTEEEMAPGPTPAVAPSTTGKVATQYGVLLSRLAEQSEWSRTEFEAMVAEYHLLPDGTFDALNEAAFEHAGIPVLEGEDQIHVDIATAKDLLA
jgi:uncharacterized tellurite resistance protein B-like protein